MRRIEKLAFTGGESHIADRLMSAWRILGGAAVPDDDPQAKPFRRIRGNDFTEDDLGAALAIIATRAVEMKNEAETGTCPYPEMPGGRVEQDWRHGLKTNADLAMREADAFADLVDGALEEAGHAKLSARTRARLRCGASSAEVSS